METDIQSIHEIAFIKTFIVKEKRDRLLELRKNRKKFRLLLAHKIEINDNYFLFLKKEEYNEENIYKLLKKYGSPDFCYLMCENSKYDSLQMNLKEILHELFNRDLGFIISCIPGKLAYFQGEDSFNRSILLYTQLKV